MAENGPIDIEGKQLQKTVDETENYKIDPLLSEMGNWFFIKNSELHVLTCFCWEL